MFWKDAFYNDVDRKRFKIAAIILTVIFFTIRILEMCNGY